MIEIYSVNITLARPFLQRVRPFLQTARPFLQIVRPFLMTIGRSIMGIGRSVRIFILNCATIGRSSHTTYKII